MGALSFLASHNVIFTAVLAFGLGMWVYYERRQVAHSTALAALLVTISFWSFAFVLWRMAPDVRQAQFWLRTIYFIGSLLPPLFLFFAWSLWRGSLPRTWQQVVLLLPNAFFFWLIYGTETVIVSGPTASAVSGSAFIWLAAYFVVMIAVSLLLVRLAASHPDLDQRSLVAVIVGTIIAFDSIFAVMYGGSLSSVANSFWIADIALLTGVFIIVGGLVREQLLLDLRLVGAEVFVLITSFIIVADIVVAQSFVDFALRLMALVVLVCYGILLIRNMVRGAQRIKEVRLLNEHVIQMNGRLLEADRAKTQFLSLASHQLRAPLGGMRSYLDMMLKGDFGPLNERQKHILDLNLGAIVQALQTIETFLNLARIELGKLELFRSQVDLLELTGRVLDSVRPLAQSRGLQIEVSIPGSIGMVECDGGKIYHVMLNLVDNAIKYTEKGTIRIVAKREAGRVEVRVSDSGIGLSVEETEHLFGLFRRGLSAARMDPSGAGLGLFLVKHIVAAHGGDVIVESAGKGQGSTFGFWLPA
ncbi:MAG: ATP-binding protein [Patescibacteria group bacterium]|nr:ATP-binding protein [Patescibacteria group bacterium]